MRGSEWSGVEVREGRGGEGRGGEGGEVRGGEVRGGEGRGRTISIDRIGILYCSSLGTA